MNRYLGIALSLIIALPLVELIFNLPGWFLGNNRQIQVPVVTDFLTFDGIMVAVTAIFTSYKPNDLLRPVLLISIEFVLSSTAFLLSFRGIIGTTNVAVHAGDAVRIGLSLTFAGVVSLLVLMLGTYLTELLGKPIEVEV